MVYFDPSTSKAAHESAVAERLAEVDPGLGAILAPYLRFERIDGLSDIERRRLRVEIAASVRKFLDAEEGGE